MSTTCYCCKAAVEDNMPRAGLTRLWGRITRTTWRIRFNYLRMNSWENAKTSAEVIESALYTDVELCSDCWGDVLTFITGKARR